MSNQRNDDPKIFADSYQRLMELVAEFEVALVRERHEQCLRESPSDTGSLGEFVTDLISNHEWQEQLVCKVQNAIEQIVARGPLKIRHVYYQHAGWNGASWHSVEVNGTRGERGLYQGIAEHPDGFIAVTDYHSGTPLVGDRTAVPEGGQLWAVVPIPYELGTTLNLPEEATAAMSLDEVVDTCRKADKTYDAVTPNAHEALFRKQKPNLAEMSDKAHEEVKAVQDEDASFDTIEAWKQAAQAKVKPMNLFYSAHNRDGYPAISAMHARNGKTFHIGEFRCDTQRGVVYS